MQWRGDGPKIPNETSRNRQLRSISAASTFQQFKKRVLTRDNSNHRNRRLQVTRLDQEYNQVVTFRNCVFRNNFVTEEMGFPGVIENSFESELKIVESVFMENIYGSQQNPAPFGYAVRSFGPLTIESSCFVDNVFFGRGPIQVLGAPHTMTNNYVRTFQEDVLCNFLAVLSSRDDTTDDLPICFNSDASTCPIELPPSQPSDYKVNTPAPPLKDTSGTPTFTPAIVLTIIGLFSTWLLL